MNNEEPEQPTLMEGPLVQLTVPQAGYSLLMDFLRQQMKEAAAYDIENFDEVSDLYNSVLAQYRSQSQGNALVQLEIPEVALVWTMWELRKVKTPASTDLHAKIMAQYHRTLAKR